MLTGRGRTAGGSCLLALACAAAAGCGARTGLEVPEAPRDVAEPPRDAFEPAADAARARPPPPPPAPPAEPVPEICVRASTERSLDGATPLELRIAPRVRVADVVLLIDETSSMNDEIENIRRRLVGSIVPGVRAEVPGAQFAVATFGDFPFPSYGASTDQPFRVRTPVTWRTDLLVDALSHITAGGGGDAPESSIEALYQVATNDGYAPWIRRAPPCASPAHTGPLCLRPEAVPLVLVFTDAPAHNGPRPVNGYRDPDFTARGAARGPHRYAEAVTALRRIGAAVIGIDSSRPADTNAWSAGPDLAQLAHDTGALAADGAPLVFDIGFDGRGLDGRVLEAVRAFVGTGRLEVSARIVALDGVPVAPDALAPLRPLRAEPDAGAERRDDAAFYNVVPGTQLVFAFALPPVARPGYTATERRARVQFYGNGRPSLGAVDVRVLPGDSSGLTSTDACPPEPMPRDR